MESSLSKHITELNKLSYKDQCAYIAKRLISMEPDDITHPTFFKKLQIILIDIPLQILKMREDVIIVLVSICLMITFFIR